MATTLELGVGLAVWLGVGQQAAVLAGAANGIGDRAGIPATDYDVTFLGRLVVPARTAAAGTASPPGGSTAELWTFVFYRAGLCLLRVVPGAEE